MFLSSIHSFRVTAFLSCSAWTQQTKQRDTRELYLPGAKRPPAREGQRSQHSYLAWNAVLAISGEEWFCPQQGFALCFVSFLTSWQNSGEEKIYKEERTTTTTDAGTTTTATAGSVPRAHYESGTMKSAFQSIISNSWYNPQSRHTGPCFIDEETKATKTLTTPFSWTQTLIEWASIWRVHRHVKPNRPKFLSACGLSPFHWF